MPHEPRYRNNLAVLLVRAGMLKDAYQQLREVYDEPVAHYDLGYLLNKRGMKAAALQEFTVALQMSPRMALAREWVERLSRERGDYGPAAVGMSGPPAPPVAPGPVPMNQPLAAPPLPAAPMPPPYATPQQQYTGLPAQVPASNPCALVRRSHNRPPSRSTYNKRRRRQCSIRPPSRSTYNKRRRRQCSIRPGECQRRRKIRRRRCRNSPFSLRRSSGRMSPVEGKCRRRFRPKSRARNMPRRRTRPVPPRPTIPCRWLPAAIPMRRACRSRRQPTARFSRVFPP